MAKKVFVEQRPDGTYAASLANAKRASALRDTQKAAIKAAVEMHPDAYVYAEHVRNTKVDQRDHWRIVRKPG